MFAMTCSNCCTTPTFSPISASKSAVIGTPPVSSACRRKVTCSVVQAAAWWGGVQKPDKVELEPVATEDDFNRVLLECQQSNKAAVFEWMALWCRKCIYLKPKLEKLAAEFYPDFNFYCVDVNSVPKSLVERASVTKMPTIQLWRNGEKQGEVIGGHQAWLVLDEVRAMLTKKV